jgi:hypothetical protein
MGPIPEIFAFNSRRFNCPVGEEPNLGLSFLLQRNKKNKEKITYFVPRFTKIAIFTPLLPRFINFRVTAIKPSPQGTSLALPGNPKAKFSFAFATCGSPLPTPSF